MSGEGTQWEALLAFRNTILNRVATYVTAENDLLLDFYGSIDDGSGVDLFIPAVANVAIKMTRPRLIDPNDCPAVYITPAPQPAVSSLPHTVGDQGSVDQTIFVTSYVTGIIKVASPASAHKLNEEEVTLIGLALGVAVSKAIRVRSVGHTVWNADAGLIEPALQLSTIAPYNMGEDFEHSAAEVVQTWTVGQRLRY